MARDDEAGESRGEECMPPEAGRACGEDQPPAEDDHEPEEQDRRGPLGVEREPGGKRRTVEDDGVPADPDP